MALLGVPEKGRAETAHPCLCPHPSPLRSMPWGEEDPPRTSAATTPRGGKRFSAPVPSPLQPQGAGAGLSHPHHGGAQPRADRGACQKRSREGLKPAGSRTHLQGGSKHHQKPSLVPAASGLCASAGSAVMATTIKYDGSWSSAAVLFVSHSRRFGPWISPALGGAGGAGVPQVSSEKPSCRP